MSISAFCYIDNQEECQYPIDYIYSRMGWVERKYIFVNTSDDFDRVHAFKQTVDDLEIVKVGISITRPVDIAIAQNAALSWLRTNDKSDFFLLTQASKLPLKSCEDLCLSFANPGNMGSAFKYGCRYVRMYAKAYIGMFGAVIIGKNCQGEFSLASDGAPSSFPCGDEPSDHDWKAGVPKRAMDLGYFSTEMAARHIRRNGKIWNSPEWVALANGYFAGDREAFVRRLFLQVKEYNRGHLDMVNPDTDADVYRIMDDFYLWDDYKFAIPIAQSVGGAFA